MIKLNRSSNIKESLVALEGIKSDCHSLIMMLRMQQQPTTNKREFKNQLSELNSRFHKLEQGIKSVEEVQIVADIEEQVAEEEDERRSLLAAQKREIRRQHRKRLNSSEKLLEEQNEMID